MVYILFIVAAAGTVFAAIKLSAYADVISEKSAIGGLMVGTILLAGATSLPELTSIVTAGLIENPDLAVGNVLGSNLYNLLILAGADIAFRRRTMFSHARNSHVYTSLLVICMSLIILASLLLEITWSVFGVSVDVLIICVVYGVGLYLINKRTQASEPKEKKQAQSPQLSLRAAQVRFGIAAVVILIGGTALTFLGDQIAVQTGLGSSFVGSFLIAGSTSLPEIAVVVAALRLRQSDLAVGSIMGSNLFNLTLLLVGDVFYSPGPLLAAASGANFISTIGIIVLSLLVIYAVKRKRSTYSLVPSFLVIGLYFACAYLIFQAN
ncbi:sodium:calcium antiporter [Shouchella shacheensis]|uniref:sodium:calcium antiporter n=1 Tax=Shouchella shacheensis TaxID=1649580 RepID=UPI00073FC946|nr:sodium:calcium antiporter [Shouchella shacheensis]